MVSQMNNSFSIQETRKMQPKPEEETRKNNNCNKAVDVPNMHRMVQCQFFFGVLFIYLKFEAVKIVVWMEMYHHYWNRCHRFYCLVNTAASHSSFPHVFNIYFMDFAKRRFDECYSVVCCSSCFVSLLFFQMFICVLGVRACGVLENKLRHRIVKLFIREMIRSFVTKCIDYCTYIVLDLQFLGSFRFLFIIILETVLQQLSCRMSFEAVQKLVHVYFVILFNVLQFESKYIYV